VQSTAQKMLPAWRRFRVPLTWGAEFHGLTRDEHLLGYNFRAGEVLCAINSAKWWFFVNFITEKKVKFGHKLRVCM